VNEEKAIKTNSTATREIFDVFVGGYMYVPFCFLLIGLISIYYLIPTVLTWRQKIILIQVPGWMLGAGLTLIGFGSLNQRTRCHACRQLCYCVLDNCHQQQQQHQGQNHE
jgi:hypothetical protein